MAATMNPRGGSRGSRLLPFVMGLALAALVLSTMAWQAPAGAAPPGDGATWATATLDLPNGGIAFDPSRNELLVAVAPSVPVIGNHLVEVDPATGARGRSVAVGSDPGVVAIAGDGSRAYVGLRGSPSVTEIDLSSFSVTRSIDLGVDSGALYAQDIQVQPDHPDVIAVSRRGGCCDIVSGVVIYQTGQPRPGHSAFNEYVTSLTWGADPSILYGYDGHSTRASFYVLTVDASGITDTAGTTGLLSGFGTEIAHAGGRVHATSGEVVSVSPPSRAGTYAASGRMAIDTSHTTTFFLNGTTLSAHDSATLQPRWSRSVAPIDARQLVDTGSGLAAASASAILLIGPGATGNGYLKPVAPPSLVHASAARVTGVSAHAVAASPDGAHVYVVVPQGAAAHHGEVVEIDAATGFVTRSVFVGADPNHLAVSANGASLLVAHGNADRLTEIAVATFTIARTIPLGRSERVGTITARPGTADSFAVELVELCCTGASSGTVLVQDGVALPERGPATNGTGITFAGDPGRLYEYEGSSTAFAFSTLAVDAAGIHALSTTRDFLKTFGLELTNAAGVVYASDGSVIDPVTPVRIGSVSTGGQPLPAPDLGRIFMVSGSSIDEYDLNEHWKVASSSFPGGVTVDAALAGHTIAVVTAAGNVTLIPLTPPPPPSPPAAPSSVVATPAGPGMLRVTWSAAVADGGAPVLGYRATAAPGGASCAWTAGPPQCTIAGLTDGVTYTVTVRSANAVGQSAPSAPSPGARPGATPTGSYFHSVNPTRILDTRTLSVMGSVHAGAPGLLTVTGAASGVPPGATAVVMNVTVTCGSADSFLTVFPAGQPAPTTSNLNFAVQQTVANLVTVPVGTDGRVGFANAVGGVDVVADILGYYDSVPAGRFTALEPHRILDSRSATGGWPGKLTAGPARTLQVTGAGGVPATAESVIANVTVTNGTADSFLTVAPTGEVPPATSNLNFAAGQTTSNLVAVKVGDFGTVSVGNAAGAVHVVVDVLGFFDTTSGDLFHPLTPARVLDSRGPVGGWDGLRLDTTTRILTVTGRGGVAADASAVIGNMTATAPTAPSFLTVYPDGVSAPTTSNLNFAAGATVPNAVAVGVGPAGRIRFRNAVGATHVVLDVAGYFAPT